ncbi:LuxR C-terminal-related transcriptional regulator [Cnuibacter sp. UC19_7]|uniref:helix-turn-helix transcriptional regulator n=1 Tax=Cnuibacter sp. UC19_7 TaxID=3350166 RepID=UPI00366F42C1
MSIHMPETSSTTRRSEAAASLVGRSRQIEQVVHAIAADPAVAVSIAAPRGVGRTALLQSIRERMGSATPTYWVAGDGALSALPLGALAPLFADLDIDPASEGALVAVHKALSCGAVVFVDDAHLLDEASAGVVAQLIRSGDVSVVSSTVDDTAGARQEEGLRVRLAPLDDTDQRQVATSLLGVAPHPHTVDEIVRLADGSTRILVALAEAVRDSPLPPDAHGSISERLAPSRAIVDALPVDPFAAPEPVIDLLSLLAVCGSLPLELRGEPGASTRWAAEAEQRGLVRSYEEEGRRWVALAHPMLEPVVLMDVSPLRRYDYCAAGADMLSGSPAHRVRHALLRLRAGIPVDARELDLLARGELRAQHYGTALTLGEHAVLQNDGDAALRASGQAIRAQAASQIGRIAEATEWFADAWTTASEAAEPPSQEFFARLAQAEGNHLAFRLLQPATAVRRVEEILDRIHEPRWRAFVDSDLVKWRMMAGEGLPESVDELPVLQSVESPGDLNLLIMTAMIQTTGGSLEAARTATVRGLREAERFADVLPNARDLLRLSDVLARAFGGDVGGARAQARDELTAAESANPSARGMWEFVLAIIELHAGCPVRGWKLIVDARRDLLWRDIAGLLPTAEAVHAALAARTARFAVARRWLDRHPADSITDPKTALYAQLARAWVTAASGRPGFAVRALASVAGDAIERGQLYLGALCAYEGVRIDPVVGATVMLPHLARAQHAFSAQLAHVRVVLARGDVLPAARDLAEAGLLGPAIDAARWCAETTKDRAQQGEATRLADAWTVRTGVAITPRRTDTQPRMTPLTDREWQLASGAASLRTSAELAAEYGISVRTVDNHLARIYRKLGIASRRELAAELGALGAENPHFAERVAGERGSRKYS